MGHKILYKKSVRRDLARLDTAEARRVLDRLEEELSENAFSYPALKGQFAGLRKYRVGDYRVIYVVLGDDVLVLRIAHRKDVYRKDV